VAEDKQFEPTQSRLDRAKREGDVARSQELGNVAAFGGALLAAAFVAAPIGNAAAALLFSATAGHCNTASAIFVLFLMLVPAAAAACSATVCSVLQAGGVRVNAIALKFERLSPSQNLKRMFSREALVTAVRATAAFLCAGAAIVPAVVAIYAAALQANGISTVASAAWSGALRTAAVACAIGGVFALADFGLQRSRWLKRLRMSFEEMKRDQKEHDGDPHARSRRRSLHRQIARGSLRRVKDAAFVVTNPTHIAVALEYRPPEVAVPRVLVRAADESAARVRELAAAYGIPLVANVALARRLYATTEPGEYIPHETYIAVAEIVAALVSSRHAAAGSDTSSGNSISHGRPAKAPGTVSGTADD
jgi:flagellar biosynthesis protein FlhB